MSMWAEDNIEYLDNDKKWEIILIEDGAKKEIVRLVVLPKTDDNDRFLGIIAGDNIKVIKAEIKE